MLLCKERRINSLLSFAQVKSSVFVVVPQLIYSFAQPLSRLTPLSTGLQRFVTETVLIRVLPVSPLDPIMTFSLVLENMIPNLKLSELVHCTMPHPCIMSWCVRSCYVIRAHPGSHSLHSSSLFLLSLSSHLLITSTSTLTKLFSTE